MAKITDEYVLDAFHELFAKMTHLERVAEIRALSANDRVASAMRTDAPEPPQDDAQTALPLAEGGAGPLTITAVP